MTRAPHLMTVEVAYILRRTIHAGELSQDLASIAHAELLLDRALTPEPRPGSR